MRAKVERLDRLCTCFEATSSRLRPGATDFFFTRRNEVGFDESRGSLVGESRLE